MASPEWYTPAPLVEAARETLGGIDLDPQSCALANRTVRARRIYTIEDDCFRHTWDGRIFINPAGGIVLESWRYLLREWTRANVTRAIWIGYSLEQLQTLQRGGPGPLTAALAICILDRRVQFDCSEEDRARMQAALDARRAAAGLPWKKWENRPTHGNYVAFLGSDLAAFHRNWQPFGEVATLSLSV